MTNRYRVAVIGRSGRGDYGHGLDTVWLGVPEVELVGVADDDKPGLAAAAWRLSLERAYADYRQMLDELKPQIVSIAPRWIDQHAEMAITAAERGIHILIEKPLCRTLAEADQIVTACERTHTKLAIAFQTRYSPKLGVAKQLVESGRLGRLLELRGRGKEDRRGGGEDLWVLGCHILDLVRYFGGDAQWCSARVTQEGRPIRKSDVQQGNEGIGLLAGDTVEAMYCLSSGATAFFGSTRRGEGPGARFGLQVWGTAGILEIQTGYLPSLKLLEDPSWSPGRSGARWQDVSSAGVGQEEPLADGGLAAGNALAVKDLMAAIEEDRQPVANVYDARASIEMIVAVFESQCTGRGVPLPLKNRDNPLERLEG